MKEIIKKVLAHIDYLLYYIGIRKCNMKVETIDETIEDLLHSQKSIVRFGDSDITMVRGRSVVYQEVNPDIVEGFKRILRYEYDGLIVAIPKIFDNLDMYRKESRQFWKDHLFFCRKIYMKNCNDKRIYGNAYITRFYYPMEDKSRCGSWIESIRQIWKDRDIVVVEGEKTHNGVGNDLLDTAHSIERIIGPSTQAYEKVDEIFECCKVYPKDRLFLVSMGIAAKFLAEKLFLEGYRVLDIGNLDMEYEWYLHQAKYKEKVPKHDIIGEEANRDAGYHEYLAQIKRKVII